MTPEAKAALLRWRLVLGRAAEFKDSALGMKALADAAEDVLPQDGQGGKTGKKSGIEIVYELDECLGFIYDGQRKGASLDDTRVVVPKDLSKWMGQVREFFKSDVVSLVQKDAIERRNLQSLLLEPETLPLWERNVDLVSTLISLRNVIPDKSRDVARRLIAEVVEQIRKRLENDLRQAIFGALRRNQHSPLPVVKNIDWRRTINRNLKNYDKDRRVIVPERFHFFANQHRVREWDVIVLVDQSGSMGQSVVYSSVMAAIMASIDVLKTRLVFFDTEIADLTEHLSDPVELLFSARLGGGTDIAKAVAYGQTLVERPDRTIFVLITDLYEGGDEERMLQTLKELVDARVKALCMLALSDGGRAWYNAELAKRVVDLGVPSFACTPQKLILILERILKGRSIDDLAGGTHE